MDRNKVNQTDRQTYSAKVLVQAEKQTDEQKDQYSHIWYIPTVLYVRKTYRQSDRQTGQTEKNDKQTNRQTDRQYMSVV